MFGLFKKKAAAVPLTLAEVEARYADRLPALVQVAAELAERNAEGRSRKGGGKALLPEDLPWPMYEGRPMLLLVQIDLTEATEALPGLLQRFPGTGILQAFIDDEAKWCSEIEPDEDSAVRVFLHPPDRLRLATGPGFPESGVGIDFRTAKTLPDAFWLESSVEESEALHETYGSPAYDQMGGWASPIQNEPAEEGRVLVLQMAVGGEDVLYITADPGALKRGRLEDLRCETQFS